MINNIWKEDQKILQFNKQGSSREMGAALSIVESLDNLYKARWLDNRTVEITEIV